MCVVCECVFGVCVCEEREREISTERQTDRQTDRQMLSYVYKRWFTFVLITITTAITVTKTYVCKPLRSMLFHSGISALFTVGLLCSSQTTFHISAVFFLIRESPGGRLGDGGRRGGEGLLLTPPQFYIFFILNNLRIQN